MVIERKRIVGVAHKRVPCVKCGEPIWVRWDRKKSCATCIECDPRGWPTSKYLHGVGRDTPEKQN